MKQGDGGYHLLVPQPHALESLVVEDVDSGSSINQCLGQDVALDLWRDDQSEFSRILDSGRVVLAALGDRLLVPVEPLGHVWQSCVHSMLNHLLFPLGLETDEGVAHEAGSGRHALLLLTVVVFIGRLFLAPALAFTISVVQLHSSVVCKVGLPGRLWYLHGMARISTAVSFFRGKLPRCL